MVTGVNTAIRKEPDHWHRNYKVSESHSAKVFSTILKWCLVTFSCLQTVKWIEKWLYKRLRISRLYVRESSHIVNKYYYKSFLIKNFIASYLTYQYTRSFDMVKWKVIMVITFLRTLKVVSARRYIKLGGKLIDLM